MNKNMADWIDNVLDTDIPDNIVAFCFNLYEEGDGNWSMELVGTDWFDEDDEDWACNEATDFGSREALFEWKMDCEWEELLDYMVDELKEYLVEGKYAALLKASVGVGVGFVSGNLEILHKK